MVMNSSNRATGRTSRMIADALKLAEQGRAVYIMAADRNHAQAIEKRVNGDSHGSIKVETPGSLPHFDWKTMTLLGAHPNCVVLADHYAIERQFSAVLEMLHRYDPPGDE